MQATAKYKFINKEEDSTTANILISGEIDDWWGTGLRELSNEISRSGADNIMIQINSPGGSVTEGQAIAAFIKGFPAKIDTNGIGLVASIATTILLSGEEVSLAEGTWFMIHNPWTFVGGEADDLRETADLLDRMQSQLADIYVNAIEKNGKLINKSKEETKTQVLEWMDSETWFTAQEALEAGFIQEVTEGVEFLNQANAKNIYNSCSKFKNVPAEFLNKVKTISEMAVKPEDAVEETAEKGLFDQLKALILGNKVEEVIKVVEEPTKEEKIAQAKALLAEEGIYKEPKEVEAVVETPAKIEEPKAENPNAEMQAKFEALELKLQKMEEERDGSPSTGDESSSTDTKAKKSLTKQLMPTDEHKAFFGDIAKFIMN